MQALWELRKVYSESLSELGLTEPPASVAQETRIQVTEVGFGAWSDTTAGQRGIGDSHPGHWGGKARETDANRTSRGHETDTIRRNRRNANKTTRGNESINQIIQTVQQQGHTSH